MYPQIRFSYDKNRILPRTSILVWRKQDLIPKIKFLFDKNGIVYPNFFIRETLLFPKLKFLWDKTKLYPWNFNFLQQNGIVSPKLQFLTTKRDRIPKLDIPYDKNDTWFETFNSCMLRTGSCPQTPITVWRIWDLIPKIKILYDKSRIVSPKFSFRTTLQFPSDKKKWYPRNFNFCTTKRDRIPKFQFPYGKNKLIFANFNSCIIKTGA